MWKDGDFVFNFSGMHFIYFYNIESSLLKEIKHIAEDSVFGRLPFLRLAVCVLWE